MAANFACSSARNRVSRSLFSVQITEPSLLSYAIELVSYAFKLFK